MLELQKSLYKKVSDISQSKTGHISVGITPQWGGEMFAEIYPIFKNKYPDYLVNLLEDTTKPLLEQVAKGTLDIAILAVAEHAGVSLPTVNVCREELVLAVPVSIGKTLTGQRRPGAALPVLDIKALKNENFIISCSGTAIRDITNQLFDQWKLSPRIICEINNHSSSLKMVASGLGITIIPLSYRSSNPRICYYSMGDGAFWNICTVAKRSFQPNEPDSYLIELVQGYFTKENMEL